jgi:hypothetical protein
VGFSALQRLAIPRQGAFGGPVSVSALDGCPALIRDTQHIPERPDSVEHVAGCRRIPAPYTGPVQRAAGTRSASARVRLWEGGDSSVPDCFISGCTLLPGAGFVPDSYSERLPPVAAHWIYAPAQQGAWEMRRIGHGA